ncbi:hypothetical protein S40285_10164 [Stachybotrys chlorohalonatus IBT 40285]|uniref:Uncharacterized protein n=1 Tax=Stachybotrys chlorohalonatus (strain IBT 40285) TaxID=1283841 RepID=A0A084QCA0_STAC4|nr:hypothetical protein S40285_10164 [Stachybotrys chlorohalonata IBT 40285]
MTRSVDAVIAPPYPFASAAVLRHADAEAHSDSSIPIHHTLFCTEQTAFTAASTLIHVTRLEARSGNGAEQSRRFAASHWGTGHPASENHPLAQNSTTAASPLLFQGKTHTFYSPPQSLDLSGKPMRMNDDGSGGGGGGGDDRSLKRMEHSNTIRGKARASAGWGNARHRLAVTPSSYNIIATGVTTGQAGPGQDPGCLVGRLIWWVAPNHPNQAIPTRRLAGALSALSLSCRRSRPPSPAAASKEDAQGRARGSKQHQPPDYVSNNNSRVPSAGLLFPTLAWLVVHGHCPQLLLICG